jgi:hypothetical protein
MRKPANIRRAPLAPTDDNLFVHLTADALVSAIADLRCRVEHAGTPRQVAQVLLAEAHVAEAAGLIRTIRPMPSPGECAPHGPSLRPAPPTRSRVPQPRRPHRAHRPVSQRIG